MRFKLFLAMCVAAHPVWSAKHWDVIKREWKMERL